jgi:hypothetical protein
MTIKIGNKIYDGYKQPIMIILTSSDKKLIRSMRREDHKLCYCPIKMKKEAIKKFMNIDKEQNERH